MGKKKSKTQKVTTPADDITDIAGRLRDLPEFLSIPKLPSMYVAFTNDEGKMERPDISKAKRTKEWLEIAGRIIQDALRFGAFKEHETRFVLARNRGCLTSAEDGYIEMWKEAVTTLRRLSHRKKTWDFLETFLEDCALVAEALEAKAKKKNCQLTSGSNVTGNISGTTWQEAKKEAEKIVDKEGWPGLKKLKEKIGCHKKTLRKAIDDSLRLAKAERDYKARRRPKPMELSEEVLATQEAPSDETPLSDIETTEVLNDLLKQVKANHPEMLQKTKDDLKNMDSEGRRRFAQEYRKGGFKFQEPKKPRQFKKV